MDYIDNKIDKKQKTFSVISFLAGIISVLCLAGEKIILGVTQKLYEQMLIEEAGNLVHISTNLILIYFVTGILAIIFGSISLKQPKFKTLSLIGVIFGSVCVLNPLLGFFSMVLSRVIGRLINVLH